ncbi:MAG: hypothetical protein U1E66_08320 [Rhodospirillales bacterium]
MTTAADDGNVELGLAGASLIAKSDRLWSVLEAAQYASLILQDPEAGEPSAAVDAFVDAFSALVETWEATELRNKQPLIAAVLARTDALAAAGVFVHWGVTERRFADAEAQTAALPLAVVWLDRSDAPLITIELPENLPLAQGDES